MNIMVAEKISKSYSERVLFNEISLSINDGEKIGLIGINGTGKSTLLKVIAGLETSDTGRIIYSSNLKIEYLPQNPFFKDGSTVLEQVFKGISPMMKLLREYESALQIVNDNLGDSTHEEKLIGLTHKMDNMQAWTIETEAKSILTKLGILDFKADVSKLSGGQRKRVAIASALISPADLLILDEPTNHIDNDTVDWIEKYLQKRKGALLMVTHDRYFLDRVANRIVELDDGKMYSYQVNYTKYLEMKAEREEIEEASQKKLQGFIRRELAWIQRGAKARSTKQKARVERFEKLTEQKDTTENNDMKIQVGFTRLGRKIIELENITKRYQCGVVIKDFSYYLMRDDRVGIIGPNGFGKSTLMKIAAGVLNADAGRVAIGETVKIGYFSQESDEMDENLRVIEYIRGQAEFLTTEDGELSASQMLERFLFPPSVQWTPISKISGGEKRRLYLLYVLMGAPNVIMLDEPTNDLDIHTLSILESYLDEFAGAVIVISHDRYFLDRVVDRIFSFEGDGLISQYAGNYTDYKQHLQQRDSLQEGNIDRVSKDKNQVKGNTSDKASNKTSDIKSDQTTNKTKHPTKFTYKEQKEYDEIDRIIAAIELNISKTSEMMEQSASDYELLLKLINDKEELEKQLEDAIERWTYLSELAQKIELSKKES